MSQQISVQCPKCGARMKLKNRESLGKKLLCPKCQQPFLAEPLKEPQTDIDFVSAPGSIQTDDGAPDENDEAPQRAPAPRRSSASRKERTHKRSKSTGWRKPALVAGSGLLGVALLVGLVWTAVSVFPGAGDKQRINLAWLPPDTELVLSVRVGDAWNAPVLKSLVTKPEVLKNFDELREKIGLAPADIQSVIVGAAGMADRRRQSQQAGNQPSGAASVPWPGLTGVPTIMVIRTNVPIDPLKLLDYARQSEQFSIKTIETVSHAGATYYRIPIPAGKGPEAVGAFLPDEQTIVVGPENDVKSAIERGANVVARPDLDFLDLDQHLLWAYVPKDRSVLQQNPIPRRRSTESQQKLRQALQEAVQGGSFGLKFSDGIDFQVQFHCLDASQGQQFKSCLDAVVSESLTESRQKIAASKQQIGQLANTPHAASPVWNELNELVEKFVDSVQATQAGSTVVIKASVPSSAGSTLAKIPQAVADAWSHGPFGVGAIANKQQADSTSNSTTPGVTKIATIPGTPPVAPVVRSATPFVPAGMAASQPRLPDAVTQAPAWLVGHAPFDVVNYFDVPPLDQNAAPLYLDAIAEFSADVKNCFPTDQQQTQRFQAVTDRMKRYTALEDKPRTAATAPQWDELLRDYDIGFQKLTIAQQRPKCVFETGVGPLALLLHAQAARHVVRMADERVRRDLEHGNFDRPLQTIEMCLRLSRDLRPRGREISQFVSAAMDGIILETMVRRVITTSGIKREHCDRLLAMLHEHDQRSQNLHLETAQGQYISQRATLRAIQDPAERRKIKEGLRGDDDSAGAILLAMTDNYSMFSSDGKVDGLASDRFAASFQKANELLAKLDERQEIAAFDEQYRTVVALGQQPYRERAAGWSLYETTFKETFAREVKLLVTRATMENWGGIFEVFTRSATKRHGTQALVALRRWQLTHTEPPRDLAQVMSDGGFNAVPRDDYADAPLKLATLKGQPLIYSIGPDGKDDGGAVVWNPSVPKGPGDVLFQLAPPK